MASFSDACLQDIRYAQKAHPALPELKRTTQLTIVMAGQPETGRTTTARNLFAAMANDPNFHPKDVSSYTWDDFVMSPNDFVTSINCDDELQKLTITYNILVRLAHVCSTKRSQSGQQQRNRKLACLCPGRPSCGLSSLFGHRRLDEKTIRTNGHQD
jgi:septin family protein